jgi:hypothetical protein
MPLSCRGCSTSSPPPFTRRCSSPPHRHKPECQTFVRQPHLPSPEDGITGEHRRSLTILRWDDEQPRCSSMLVSSTTCQSGSSAEDADIPPRRRPLGRMNTVPNNPRTTTTTMRNTPFFDSVLPLFRSSSFSGGVSIVRPPSNARLSTMVGPRRDSAATLFAPLIHTGRRNTSLQSRLEQQRSSAPGTAYYLQSLPLPVYSHGLMGPISMGGASIIRGNR